MGYFVFDKTVLFAVVIQLVSRNVQAIVVFEIFVYGYAFCCFMIDTTALSIKMLSSCTSHDYIDLIFHQLTVISIPKINLKK